MSAIHRNKDKTKQLSLKSKIITCKEEEDENHNHSVSKVQYSACRANYLQFWEEVVHSVDKEIDCCEAAGQEWTPPPMVVLDESDKRWRVRVR